MFADEGMLGAWHFDPVTVIALLTAGSVYAVALGRARANGRVVRRARVAWWYAGIAALAVALVSPLEALADRSFAFHMAQHLMLTLVAAPLIALGAPIWMALSAMPATAARRLARALAGRAVAVLSHPVVGWTSFIGVSWGVHYSPLFDVALTSSVWHVLEHVVWVTSALIYWVPIVGVDPSPHPLGFPARLLSLVLAMPAMSFLALAIFTAEEPLYPTYASTPSPLDMSALADQRAAGVTMWLLGNVALVVAVLTVAAAWKRHDDDRQRREDARLDALLASGA